MPQTTIVSLFKYQGFKNKWKALARMGRPPVANQKIDGLTFWKPFGTGSGRGFSIRPDFSTFSLLTVFENEDKAQAFIDSEIMKIYTDKAEAHSHVLMHNISSRGEWGNLKPFKQLEAPAPDESLAVITRAKLKPRYIFAFWKKVPGISKSLDEYPEIIYQKGVGEWPLVMQVTFSIWKNKEALMDFTNKTSAHGQAARKAVEKDYFKDSLFARFHPFDIQGGLIKSIK